MDTLLLAEGITLDYKVLITIITAAVSIGGTIAVIKFRASQNATDTKAAKKKVDQESVQREKVDDKLEAKLDKLVDQFGDGVNDLASRIVSSEQKSTEQVEGFKNKVFSRFDTIDNRVRDIDKRVALNEKEHEHLKEKVDKHGRKLTRLPTRDSDY